MWFVILCVTVIFGLLIYKLFISPSENFFKKHGIPEVDTSVAIGTLDRFLNRKPACVADEYAYSKMTNYCGVMDMGSPVILVKDESLLKKILIKDFDHFIDHRQFFTEKDGSFYHMLFNLQGDDWKGARTSISPAFSTSKIRKMMEFFNAVGQEWVEEFTHQANGESSRSVKVDVLNAVNRYTIQLISTAVFGMNANVIKNPDAKFLQLANRFSGEPKFLDMIKFMFSLSFPKLAGLLGISLVDQEATSFFESLLEEGLQSRMSGESQRNDFLQLLVEARKGEMKAAENEELTEFEKDAEILGQSLPPKKQYLTEQVMTASCMEFFVAGYTTTSYAITFTLYALALHPEIQTKLREQVKKIVKEDGTLDYDDVRDLEYMDMVLNETMRKFPAVSRYERVCTKDYRDADSGLEIPKGTMVGIPLTGIHNDKQYYDNPEGFDPEHFSKEKKAQRSSYAFMPFGVGPRSCIGVRFALIQVKSALTYMIHNFLIEPTDKTPVPLQAIYVGISFAPPKNLELKLTPIQT